jgi:hypothetical protein
MLFAPLIAQADIFKCVAENGEVTFSQTPCPSEDTRETEDRVESTEQGKKPVDGSADEPADSDETASMFASANPQASHVPHIQSEQENNAALSAQKRRGEALEEEQRLQCENNIKAQIKNINLQIQSGFASSLAESLRIKRRALEDRLDNC